MSQQLDRAGVRPADSPLLTYTGQVMLIGEPEIGSTGKERPRKVVISDRPGNYQGKTFRIWAWKEAEFEQLTVGAWVTVGYEVEPNPNPERHGSNMISVVSPATAQGGGQAEVGGEVSGSQPASQPTYAPNEPDWSVPTQSSPAPPADKPDDYWEQRTLEIESAWAIKSVLDIESFRAADLNRKEVQDTIVASALQLVILKRQTASELGRG